MKTLYIEIASQSYHKNMYLKLRNHCKIAYILSKNCDSLVTVSFYEYNLYNLNCLCHLYGSIHHRMHIWAPLHLVYSKVYVYMNNLFFFIVLSLRSVRQNEDAPCYARPIHGKGALAIFESKICRVARVQS